MTYMEFAERVRACIYAKNMTITEFARRAKIGETTVYAWFEGGNYPNTKTLMSAADVLGTHPNYLLGYDDDPVRPRGGTNMNEAFIVIVLAAFLFGVIMGLCLGKANK